MSVQELVAKGVLSVAKNAHENPKSLGNLASFAIGYASKDYPAQTPRLWNALYQHFKLAARNIRLIGAPEAVSDVLPVFRKDDRYIGGDIGAGIKDKAWSLVDRLDPLAEAMQSINVISKENGQLIGHNTDGPGYVAGLKSLLDPAKSSVLLLGGGGTANSIAFSLGAAGAKLIILNRTVSKAEELAKRVNIYFKSELARFGGRDQILKYAPEADLVVSVIDDPYSPLDQYSALGKIELPVSPESLAVNTETAQRTMATLKSTAVISDVMLRDAETATLRLAREAGFRTQNGRPMVLEQAIIAYWIVNSDTLKRLGVTIEDVAKVMREIA
jgi:shikimate dehydrogenase